MTSTGLPLTCGGTLSAGAEAASVAMTAEMDLSGCLGGQACGVQRVRMPPPNELLCLPWHLSWAPQGPAGTPLWRD